MAIDDVVVIYVGHPSCDFGDRMFIAKVLAKACLALDEKHCTKGTAEQYLIIEWVRRMDRRGKHIVRHVGGVNS
jgi:hypothetical protein